MIPGVVLSRQAAHADDRGRFVEVFRAAGQPARFVQANHSRSGAGVLRGLHYHRHQSDLWYVVSEHAQVALVDLRARVPRPQISVMVLRDDNPSTLFIPPGVAHGFLALSDVDLIYWVTHEYDASDEYGIAWDDPALAIAWEADDPILSDRDKENPNLQWELIPSFL